MHVQYLASGVFDKTGQICIRPGAFSAGVNILEFNGVVLSVIGDLSVDSEASMVTSSISKIF